MNFNETDEFAKNFKRLSKKYRSLSDDLVEFKKVVSEFPLGSGKHFVILHSQEEVKILKARLFCRYLRGASLRIIYAYQEIKGTIDFIELYPKNEQINESRQLIKEFLSQFSK
ncbi:hypothetical protein COW77_02615 [Candidatus Wolfebacteria bacterium CG18_big_fil_WC_8_21_14_2_50_39_7]|uniref:Uncharacterized protein n=5 Tax=Candidatus Wolfeibacteriota TaxID=1752735 RepID=A0A2M7Q669_9BACT|nr:hypothetical protein [Parcubacteria group bacterium]NCP58513.1 hypothetical protein [Candidatus Wolfebacteria bacterium]OIO65027.1 MAG: hypothetical protein AUJ30_01615 [Candidatus Wolfebacteria bacterium CG1_02_39_135]PIP91975.1 MAG: hypothetical protein COW77_02615 [Candidatus Wolfebacteria bacterium CG18_big_fil_WC_8_21_14_2_50_39_7]PIU98697.1 MAG: hypothetical protein COS60_01660 [Candidatus Wolfebacteria bacterium CG03_land_8_20_14_0_80_39_317]PIY58918.1 MAG: hypothetical protein COY97